MVVKPAPDYIQLEKLEEKRTLAIVGTVEDSLCRATVLAVGQSDGTYPMPCAVGDTVLVHTGAGVRAAGLWFVFASRKDIVAVVE